MTEKTLNAVFLEGKKVNLRPIMRADLPLLLRWINDPYVRAYLGVANFPKTEREEEEWISGHGKSNTDIALGVETKDGVLIGTMGIHQIDWVNRVGITGALIGEKDYWGKGYGTDAKMILLDYAFNTLNFHKLCSAVIAFNKRSLAYSIHCGYKVEGRRRKQIFRKGKYWDVIELGLFREEWLPYWNKYRRTKKVR